MKNLFNVFLLLMATCFIGCISEAPKVPTKPSPQAVDFLLIKQDTSFSLSIQSFADSLSREDVVGRLINLISSNSDAGTKTFLKEKYLTQMGTPYAEDLSKIVHKNLIGGWKVETESFNDTLSITQESQVNFLEPNLIVLLYKDEVLYLKSSDNALIGTFKNEKITLTKN